MSLLMRFENGICIDPRTLDRADKEKLVGSVFVCTCRKDIELKYSLRKGTLALYPKENRFAGMHSIFCELNEVYNDRSKCSALSRDDSGDLTAKLKENIIKSPKRYDEQLSHRLYTKKRPDKDDNTERDINLSALIKDINLEACYRQSQRMLSGKQTEYKSLNEYNKFVWGIANNTHIKGKDIMLAGDSLKPYGVKFDYSQILGVSKIEYIEGERKRVGSSSLTKSYLEEVLKPRIDANKTTYLSLVYESNFDGKTRYANITPKALYFGARHFLDTYKMASIDFENDKICGGFYSYETGSHIDKRTGKSIADFTTDRLILLLVNSYGVFSESRYEAAAYDAIMDYCKDKKVYPYKPYRFTSNAYGGEYLEDMRLQVKDGKDIIIEIFGMMSNEDYAEKTRLKEKFFEQSKDAFVFVPWYPQSEGESILIARIGNALNEVYK